MLSKFYGCGLTMSKLYMRQMKYIPFTIFIILAGCTTALLGPRYTEHKINGFYINNSTNDLIVTTANKAFIFPIDPELSSALTGDFMLEPYFNGFTINENNRVSGVLELYERVPDLSEKQKERLIELGFIQEYKYASYGLTKKLDGKIFNIEGQLPLETIEIEYSVMIAQPATTIENIGKLIASPVSIAYDSVVVVPAVIVGATIMATGGK